MDYTARIARQIDSIIYKNYPEVTLVSASSGANSSDDAFAAMQTTGSHIINYNLSLPTSDKRERSIYVISDLLRKELDRIPEVREYSVMPGGDNGSMSGSATVDIKVFGYDMDVTNAVANDLKEKLGGLEGTRDVQLSRDDLRPELNVVFDRDRLAYYGMNSATASQAVRNRIDGLVASKYREDGDEYDIVVRYAEPFRMSLGDVENITLYNGQGRPVKLKEVGRVQEEYAAPMIERENRQRVITVKSSLGAGVALGDVVDQLIAGYPVPDGVDLEIGGTVEDQGDAFSDLGVLFILIVILVYIVMATQFESLLFPFIIRAALWGIFQFIVALQMCSIVSTGIYIVPLTVMNLSSHNAIGVKAQIWLAFIFAIVFFPSFFAIFSTKNVKVRKKIYVAAGSVVGVLMIVLAFTQNSVLKSTKHLAKAVIHDVYFVPKQNAAIREQYRKPAVVSQSLLETAGADYFSPDTPIKNVIVIFVEGFSAEVMDYKNHSSRNLTPTYDQLYKDSLAFDHYYNHTYATYRGLRGQLYSLWQYKAGFYPDVGNQGFGQMDHDKIKKLSKSGLVSVPAILNQHHFNTYFLSNELSTGNMTSYLKTFAFTRVYGADDLG